MTKPEYYRFNKLSSPTHLSSNGAYTSLMINCVGACPPFIGGMKTDAISQKYVLFGKMDNI